MADTLVQRLSSRPVPGDCLLNRGRSPLVSCSRFLGHGVMTGITTTGTDFLPLAVAFSPDEK
jgi:hypothetical protein